MTAKHTPGPWFAYGRYIGTANHKSHIGECRDVNGNWSDDAKASANARLIAAAPDLLDVLGLVSVRLRALGGMTQAEQIETAELVDAVIAKAGGTSQADRSTMTTMEKIAADMRAGIFPRRSEG